MRNFYTPNPQNLSASAIRDVDECKIVTESESLATLSITAPSFLTHQIRRIAWAIMAVAHKTMSLHELEVMLSGDGKSLAKLPGLVHSFFAFKDTCLKVDFCV